MALNNNYGLKINDKDLSAVLNGKWPIFGFDVLNNAKAFRTTTIRDTSVNAFYNSGITAPTNNELTYNTQTMDYGSLGVLTMTWGNGKKQMQGVVKKLITRYEHGYDYIPSGYFTITGTYNLSVKAELIKTGSGTNYVTTFGANSTDSITKSLNDTNESKILLPTMNKFLPYNLAASAGVFYPMQITYSANVNLNPDLVVQGGTGGYPGIGVGLGTLYYTGSNLPAYVSVEIDARYVNIYMNYSWYDSITRVTYSATWNPPQPSQNADYDAQVRGRMVAQTTGSQFDVTVYLTPHKLQEMILND